MGTPAARRVRKASGPTWSAGLPLSDGETRVKKHAAVAAATAVLASLVMSAGASAHEESESEEGGLEVELRPAIVDVGELVVVEAEYDDDDETSTDEESSTDDESSTDEESSTDDESSTEDGGTTSPTDGTATTFEVDFGAGFVPMTAASDDDDDEESAQATHTYDTAGEYTVTVRATPAVGTPVETSVLVMVGSGSARLAGDDRYGTAERLSREDFPTDNSASAVLLARSDGFADALASASLAVLEDAPVLLTTGDTVPVSVLDEIGRALVPGGTVYLLGGEAAIPETAADALRAEGYEVVRIAGSDRIDTAVAIAEFLLASGVEIDEVVVANGANFPDALSGAAFAAAFDAPVLLTGADAIDSRVADLLGRLDAAETEVLVAGGVAAVSDAVVAELVEMGFGVERISGEDRYETSAEVAERLFPLATEVVLATGTNFPDALAGAAMAGRSGAPVLLVGDTLPDAVRDYFEDRVGQITAVYVLGGDAVVPDAVLAEVKAILGL